jgi:hypothetical protein
LWISVYYVAVRVVVFSEPLHTAVYSILYPVLNYPVSFMLFRMFKNSEFVCGLTDPGPHGLKRRSPAAGWDCGFESCREHGCLVSCEYCCVFVPCGQTDRHDEADSRFSQFCECT